MEFNYLVYQDDSKYPVAGFKFRTDTVDYLITMRSFYTNITFKGVSTSSGREIIY